MLITSENSKPEISCIYINYRSSLWLQRSLESLIAHETDIPFEVIIVNNDENERQSIEDLQKKYPLRIFHAPDNPGFGVSANLGAQKAAGDILFFINPDTKWKEPFFAEAKKRIESSQSKLVLGIQLVSSEGIPEKRNTGKFFLFSDIFKKSNKQKKIEWLSGGALLVPKKIFKEVGGFDEQFFMYFEDMDFCLQLQKKGYQVDLLSQKLIHYGGQSHRNKKNQKTLYDQSLYLYTKKHWSPAQYFLFRFMHRCYRFFFPYGRS